MSLATEHTTRPGTLRPGKKKKKVSKDREEETSQRSARRLHETSVWEPLGLAFFRKLAPNQEVTLHCESGVSFQWRHQGIVDPYYVRGSFRDLNMCHFSDPDNYLYENANGLVIRGGQKLFKASFIERAAARREAQHAFVGTVFEDPETIDPVLAL